MTCISLILLMKGFDDILSFSRLQSKAEYLLRPKKMAQGKEINGKECWLLFDQITIYRFIKI